MPASVLERTRSAAPFSISGGDTPAGTAGAPDSSSQTPEVARKFEAMVISFMLKDVIKSDMESAFGKGAGADHYVSMFADAVANDIVDAGGFGISQKIATTRVSHE